MQFKLLSLFALAFLASSVVAAPLPQDGLAIASENMDDSQRKFIRTASRNI